MRTASSRVASRRRHLDVVRLRGLLDLQDQLLLDRRSACGMVPRHRRHPGGSGRRLHGAEPTSRSAGGFAGDFYDITYGFNYKPNGNLTVRPEIRYDCVQRHRSERRPSRTARAPRTISGFTRSMRSCCSNNASEPRPAGQSRRAAAFQYSMHPKPPVRPAMARRAVFCYQKPRR